MLPLPHLREDVVPPGQVSLDLKFSMNGKTTEVIYIRVAGSSLRCQLSTTDADSLGPRFFRAATLACTHQLSLRTHFNGLSALGTPDNILCYDQIRFMPPSMDQ